MDQQRRKNLRPWSMTLRAFAQGRRDVPYVPKKQHGLVRQHGRAAYRKGCRCDDCRHAEASYRRQYRQARR